MNDDGPSRAARETRESFDKTMAAGAETTRRVQEGFTSAVENVCDLNVRLIDMGAGEHRCGFPIRSPSRSGQNAV